MTFCDRDGLVHSKRGLALLHARQRREENVTGAPTLSVPYNSIDSSLCPQQHLESFFCSTSLGQAAVRGPSLFLWRACKTDSAVLCVLCSENTIALAAPFGQRRFAHLDHVRRLDWRTSPGIRSVKDAGPTHQPHMHQTYSPTWPGHICFNTLHGNAGRERERERGGAMRVPRSLSANGRTRE